MISTKCLRQRRLLHQNIITLLKVREFMFNDIEKTLCLAVNPQVGAPNFLLALNLCCYTEY